MLLHIREQNLQIIQLLKSKNPSNPAPLINPDFPVNLPIDTEENLEIFETFLKENENLNVLVRYYLISNFTVCMLILYFRYPTFLDLVEKMWHRK